ncbi:hypothetical protein scyTo_0019092 [Scyliorhinus torazame]|uniref:EVA1 domain-containing protein n=1 Tax=Scyliorhinus torazame TaxID=75743 RepID=A0A401PSL1_SCYTO|nr:hypothetical protein [Scyliorhinus torazame]
MAAAQNLRLPPIQPCLRLVFPTCCYRKLIQVSLVSHPHGFIMKMITIKGLPSRKEGQKGGRQLKQSLSLEKSHPELVGLLFVSSVCVGLIFTLCALVIRVSCRPDLRKVCKSNSDERKVDGCQDEEEGDNNRDEDESSDDNEESSSDFTFEGLTKPYGTLGSNSVEAAEIAERIERRDRIIQEIWMNGGSELPVIRNFNQYY